MQDGALPPAAVRAVLVEAAQEERAVTYAALLSRLGHRFTRPLMRQLCRVLDRIDADAAAAGEPALAVLVVRQTDRLPGQGWWVNRVAGAAAYAGPWTGPEAATFVTTRQALAFAYWGGRQSA